MNQSFRCARRADFLNAEIRYAVREHEFNTKNTPTLRTTISLCFCKKLIKFGSSSAVAARCSLCSYSCLNKRTFAKNRFVASARVAQCMYSVLSCTGLLGQHLSNLEGIKMKMSQYLNSITESAFRKCFKDWVLHLPKCITLGWTVF